MADEGGSVAGGVFVSYRRVDTAPWALRIADHLVDTLGADQVFVDVDALSPGEDFAHVIDATLRRCPVVLVLIGPQWLTVQSPGGKRRLDSPDDLVRIEVATALERAAEVIPVLVGGARLPAADELPAPLRKLSTTRPVDLSDAGFDSAMTELRERIHAVVGWPEQTWRDRAGHAVGTTAGLVVITATVVALLAAIGYVWHGRPDEPRPDARASVAVPDGGSELFLDGGDLWVYSRGASASAPEPQDQELRRVVGPDLDVVASATVAEGISEVAVVAGSVWIETGTRGQLAEVDPATGQLLRTVDTGLDVTSLAAGSDGELWVGLYDLRAFPSDIAMGSVAVLDTRSGELEPRLAVESAPLRMVADGQVLWMVRNDGTVARVDTRQAEQVNPDEASGSGSPAPGVTLAGPVTMLDGEPTPVDWNPVDVVLADGSVWVADGSSGRVYRLDPDSGEVVADTAVGVNVGVTPERVLSARDTDVWVHAYQEVVRIDTRTTEVAGRVEVPYLSESIVDDDDLWGVSSDGDEDVLERWDLADVLEPA